MNKFAVALLVAVVLVGNIATIGLLLREGSLRSAPGSVSLGNDGGGADLAPLVEAIEALRADVDRLSVAVARGPGAPAAIVAPAAGEGIPAPAPVDAALASRLDEVLERIAGLEQSLVAMKDADDEVMAAQIRKEREERFRSEDGNVAADELLADEKWALGANGILTFLEHHPDHPDARDLMIKARDAFTKAGYREKALWLQDEMMKKFPENRGADLYSRAMLERKLRKYDDALRDIAESIDLAGNDTDRMNRMFYQAYLIHQRHGDAAGLEAYREVERLSRSVDYAVTGDEAAKRADQIESSLAQR